MINIGKKEFSLGLTFVACSHVRHLHYLLFNPPFPFDSVANLANSQRLEERLIEDAKLLQLDRKTLPPLNPAYSPQPTTVTVNSATTADEDTVSPPSTPDLPHSDDDAPPPLIRYYIFPLRTKMHPSLLGCQTFPVFSPGILRRIGPICLP